MGNSPFGRDFRAMLTQQYLPREKKWQAKFCFCSRSDLRIAAIAETLGVEGPPHFGDAQPNKKGKACLVFQ
jgi:hypothetical protein